MAKNVTDSNKKIILQDQLYNEILNGFENLDDETRDVQSVTFKANYKIRLQQVGNNFFKHAKTHFVLLEIAEKLSKKSPDNKLDKLLNYFDAKSEQEDEEGEEETEMDDKEKENFKPTSFLKIARTIEKIVRLFRLIKNLKNNETTQEIVFEGKLSDKSLGKLEKIFEDFQNSLGDVFVQNCTLIGSALMVFYKDKVYTKVSEIVMNQLKRMGARWLIETGVIWVVSHAIGILLAPFTAGASEGGATIVSTAATSARTVAFLNKLKRIGSIFKKVEKFKDAKKLKQAYKTFKRRDMFVGLSAELAEEGFDLMVLTQSEIEDFRRSVKTMEESLARHSNRLRQSLNKQGERVEAQMFELMGQMVEETTDVLGRTENAVLEMSSDIYTLISMRRIIRDEVNGGDSVQENDSFLSNSLYFFSRNGLKIKNDDGFTVYNFDSSSFRKEKSQFKRISYSRITQKYGVSVSDEIIEQIFNIKNTSGGFTNLNYIRKLRDAFVQLFGSIHFFVKDFFERSKPLLEKEVELKNTEFDQNFLSVDDSEVKNEIAVRVKRTVKGVSRVNESGQQDAPINSSNNANDVVENQIEWKRFFPIYRQSLIGFNLFIKMKNDERIHEFSVESIRGNLDDQGKAKHDAYQIQKNALELVVSNQLKILQAETDLKTELENKISEIENIAKEL